MTRRQFRETCFKILFAIDFYPPEEIEDEINQYLDEETPFEGEDRDEIVARVKSIVPKVPEVDEKLKGVTEGWKLERVGKVELSILRLAAFEILFDENVPDKVAINEAVEITKKYGGEEAAAFINGVLAKLVKD